MDTYIGVSMDGEMNRLIDNEMMANSYVINGWILM